MTTKTIHGTYSGGRTLKIAYGGSRMTGSGEVNIEASTTWDTYYDGIELRDALIKAFPLPAPEDANPEPGMLPVGTRIVVTGDTGEWEHEFEPGQLGVVVKNGRGADEGYYDGRGYLIRDRFDDGVEWDVHEDDVLALLEGVR